jgi:hypothetical protein
MNPNGSGASVVAMSAMADEHAALLPRHRRCLDVNFYTVPEARPEMIASAEVPGGAPKTSTVEAKTLSSIVNWRSLRHSFQGTVKANKYRPFSVSGAAEARCRFVSKSS